MEGVPWWLSGLRAQHFRCRVAWVVTAPWVRSLAWEFLHAMGVAKKKKKKKKENRILTFSNEYSNVDISCVGHENFQPHGIQSHLWPSQAMISALSIGFCCFFYQLWFVCWKEKAGLMLLPQCTILSAFVSFLEKNLNCFTIFALRDFFVNMVICSVR